MCKFLRIFFYFFLHIKKKSCNFASEIEKSYLLYPICQTVSNKLSWSHICELITVDDDLGYFAKEMMLEGENPPIGILLGHRKDDLMVEYATYGMDTNLFISKYELFLPNKEELRKMINKITTE